MRSIILNFIFIYFHSNLEGMFFRSCLCFYTVICLVSISNKIVVFYHGNPLFSKFDHHLCKPDCRQINNHFFDCVQNIVLYILQHIFLSIRTRVRISVGWVAGRGTGGETGRSLVLVGPVFTLLISFLFPYEKSNSSDKDQYHNYNNNYDYIELFF